jgi:hypothetical protein
MRLRLFARCRGSYGTTSLHALRLVSLYFSEVLDFHNILIFQDEALQKAFGVR